MTAMDWWRLYPRTRRTRTNKGDEMGAEQALTQGMLVDARYRLVARLGEGTFGDVWRAEDLRLARRAVAVKFLKSEFIAHAEAVARFEAEADALAQVQHANVVAVLDRGAWAGLRFLVTEFVSGGPLTAWIEQHRQSAALPLLSEVRTLLDLLCAGVGAAHAVRVPGPIVHRDLKPDNVLLHAQPGGEQGLKIVDFGIAQLGGRSGTRTGAMMGTPLYMAPEQALGNIAAVGTATDVFAIAVVAIELITLQAMPAEGEPWWGAAMQRGSEVRALLVTSRRDVPMAVWDVLARALHPRAAERIADANALRAALRGAFEHSATLASTLAVHATAIHALRAAPSSATVSAGAPPTPTVWSHAPLASTTAPFSQTAAHTDPRASRNVWIAGSVALGLVALASAARFASGGHAATNSEPAATPQALQVSPTTNTATSQAPPVVGEPQFAPTVLPAPTTSGTEPPALDPAQLSLSGAWPVVADRALHAFLGRWSQTLSNQMGSASLEPFYFEQTQFRRLAALSGAPAIERYFRDAARQGSTFDLDWAHSEWLIEPITSPDVTAACSRAVGAEGDIVKVRAWAREYSPERLVNSGGDVPCPWIVGRYLLRLRRVAGELRICHETWSLREGVCASCPAARSCRSLNP